MTQSHSQNTFSLLFALSMEEESLAGLSIRTEAVRFPSAVTCLIPATLAEYQGKVHVVLKKKEKTSLAKIFCSKGHNLLCIHVLRVK